MSTTHATPTIATYFAELKDPRVERTKRHNLLAIVSIALCAIICGADSWVEVAEYGQMQQDWLARWSCAATRPRDGAGSRPLRAWLRMLFTRQPWP